MKPFLPVLSQETSSSMADTVTADPPLPPPIPGLEGLDEAFTAHVLREQVDPAAVVEMCDALVTYWTSPPGPGGTYLNWAHHHFAVPDDATHEVLHQHMTLRLWDLTRLQQLTRHRHPHLPRSFTCLKVAYEFLEREAWARLAFDENQFESGPFPKTVSAMAVQCITGDLNEYSSLQTMIMYGLAMLADAGYRRHGEDCYQQIKVGGHGTHAWKPVKTIKSRGKAEVPSTGRASDDAPAAKSKDD